MPTDNIEDDLTQGDRDARGLDPDCPACGTNNVKRVALPDGEFVCIPCGKAFDSIVMLDDLREEAGKQWDQKHASRADLDPQHIDVSKLSAEQRAVRVAQRSGMHVWALAANCQVMGLRGDLKTIDAYSVSKDQPVSATWHLHWINPALEKPMCDDNDPQASVRHLQQQLATEKLCSAAAAQKCCRLEQQLVVCRDERDDEVASLAKRSEELAASQSDLVECREACKRQHDEHATDARKLLGDLGKALQHYSFCKLRDGAWEERREMTDEIKERIAAALEPTL